MKRIVLLLAILVGLNACSRYDEEAVRETVNNFFNSIQNNNYALAQTKYPNLSLFTPQTVDSYVVDDIFYDDEKGVCAVIDIQFDGSVHRKVKLYLREDENNGLYYIEDSESLGWFDQGTYVYKYAIETGCLNQLKDLTDVQVATKLAEADKMYNYNFEKIKKELKTALVVTRYHEEAAISWRYKYVKYKIENKSPYKLVGVKYSAVCPDYWSSQSVVNTRLPWRTLEPGKTYRFNPFDNDVVGSWREYYFWDATYDDPRINFELFLDDAIHNVIRNEIVYKGDEYAEYCKKVNK